MWINKNEDAYKFNDGLGVEYSNGLVLTSLMHINIINFMYFHYNY